MLDCQMALAGLAMGAGGGCCCPKADLCDSHGELTRRFVLPVCGRQKAVYRPAGLWRG